MLRTLAVLIGVTVIFIIFSLYCCVLAASWEDDWLEEHSPRNEQSGSAEPDGGRRYGK